MPPLRSEHRTLIPAVPGSPRRGGVVAITAALMLALSACSPGQDGEAGASEETAPAAVETEAGAPGTSEDAGTEDDASAEASPSDAQDSSESEDAAEDAAEEDSEAESEAGTDAESADEPAESAATPPVSFEIPAIGAGSELLHLGLREDNTLEVPPGDPGSPASWYTGSPAPGEQGPAVLLGHVDDSLGQPGVFADLPDLVEGDEITVEQEDGSTATFEVTKAEQYGKNTFPTLEVYGNTEGEELRLITCDGYNQATGEYEDNYVVYATLVG